MATILDTMLGTGTKRGSRSRSAPFARVSHRRDASAINRLTEISGFGTDPGALRMLAYAPKQIKPGAALVVVLHGCTQTAEGYDAHSGWSALADDLGFALLYPEQRRGNNAMGCFNWFQTADTARGLGEARSIREMIETLVAKHKIDRGKIFVVGLSAGGAMAAVMLAAYPETFAAGAVIAGLPCGAAANVGQALEAMARPAAKADAELGDAVRAGAPYAGPWPRISVWQGLADQTVAPGNAELLIRQWLDVHGADPKPTSTERIGPRRRRVWTMEGRAVVEASTIEGMGHGTPLGGAPGERAGPYMLDVGVSSTREIAGFFGLLEAATAKEVKASAAAPAQRAKPTIDASKTGALKTANEGASPDDLRPSEQSTSVAPSESRSTERPPSNGRSTASIVYLTPDAQSRPGARSGSGSNATTGATAGDRGGGDASRNERARNRTPDRLDIRATIEKALRTAGLMR